ncbi:hypothetical protein AB0O18_20395 [Streptomyces sp. NPDC093224]|uniref:hypothetical protein n=1 Tax=Streptomyces sp. NPDC093224 TaxID=3155198 RepID=UPI00342CCBF4
MTGLRAYTDPAGGPPVRPAGPGGDGGCLRAVLVLPLLLLYTPAVLLCWAALALEPEAPYDGIREDVRFLAGSSVVLCLLGLLLTITPLFRRVLGRWWFALPLLLATVAHFRGQTV